MEWGGGGGGGGGVDLWRIKNGGLRFGKLQGAEFKFQELGFPGSRLLKNGEQQVDFALGKWRPQKKIEAGRQTVFENGPTFHKVAKLVC